MSDHAERHPHFKFVDIILSTTDDPDQIFESLGRQNIGGSFERTICDIYSYGPDRDDLDDQHDDEDRLEFQVVLARGGEPVEGRPVAIDYLEQVARFTTDAGPQTMALGEFMAQSARCDEHGRFIAYCALPLEEQWRRAALNVYESSAHKDDIRNAFEALKQSDHGYQRLRGYMFDVMTSSLTDGLMPEEVERILESEDGPTIVAALDAMTPESHINPFTPNAAWREVRSLPHFQLPAVREIFRRLMEERVGAFPLDRVAVATFADFDDANECLKQMMRPVRTSPPFDGGNMIPGYRTSPVEEYEQGDMRAIVFGDDMTTYCYSWLDFSHIHTAVPDESDTPAPRP